MRNVCGQYALVAVLVGVLGTLSSQRAAAETVGSVISTSGGAYAEGPAGRRSLECGTPIESGERVVTPDGARVGMLAADIYLQLDSGSDVGVEVGAEGAASFDLRSGQIRIVDTREGGTALVVGTPGGNARGAGIDTEIRIAADTTQFCEAAAELDLRSDSGSNATAQPGHCVTLAADGSLAASARGGDEIDLAGAQGCFDVAVLDHFTPGVAAASATTISLAPIDPDRTLFGPCDEPGSGCGRRLSFMPEPPGGEIIEQPPVPPTGCFPGAPAGACGEF